MRLTLLTLALVLILAFLAGFWIVVLVDVYEFGRWLAENRF